MGLDIYFHKAKGVKHPSMTIADYQHYIDREAAQNTIDVVQGVIRDVATHDGEVDDTFINEKVKEPLADIVSDWEVDNMPTDKRGLVDWLFNVMRWHSYAEADAYFRKVNFIYRYFGDKLEDEQCFVTKAEIEDLIDKCKAVLEKRDEGFSKETLPTVAGFFFGSTEYNEWYYESCENAIKQFTDLIKDFDEDKDVIWVDMSW